jgi:lauroyl/myristoyl acyltransferase
LTTFAYAARMGVANLHHLRRAVPVRLLPVLVQRRLDKFWADPSFREAAEDQMHFLLDHTDRAAEVPELAYRYAEQMMLRGYLRWHPRAITRQPVRGVEWLTTGRDPERGVVLSFAHHNRYDGLFGSLSRHGVRIHAVMTPEIMGPDAGFAFNQHERIVRRGAEIVPASVGTDGLAAILGPGATLAIASDFPGRTPVSFLGRQVLGSFGAARIATMTNSQVVLVTSWRDGRGSYLQVDPPLEPSAFDEPGALLEAILRRHGEAILAWPEALESPRARFGVLDELPTA